MKIAHITPRLNSNGVSIVIKNLTEEMQNLGHKVDIITWRESENIFNDLPIKKIDLVREKLVYKFISLIFNKHFCDRLLSKKNTVRICEQIEVSEYDIILIHGLCVYKFTKFNAKTWAVLHNTKSKMLLKGKYSLLRPFQIAFYRSIYLQHKLISVSNGVKDDMTNVFKVPANNISRIYNPLLIEEILELAEEPILEPIDNYVLAIGRLDRAKRFDRLLRAYKMSGISCDLVFLTNSTKPRKILSLAKKLNIESKVKILGYKKNPFKYMRNAKMLVCSSDYEGFGYTISEALACGTPVISTNCPSGPNEILTGKLNQYLVPVNDEHALAEKMKSVFDKPYIVPSNTVEKFCSKKITKEYLELAN